VVLRILTTDAAAIFLAACTGAVAPEGAPESKSRIAALEKKNAEKSAASHKSDASSSSPAPTPASPTSPDDPAADDSVVTPEGAALGTITDESGDIFTAASVYGVYNGTGTFKSLIITVTENEDRDLKFKKVVSWTCHTCKENDSRCVEPTPTDGSYFVHQTKRGTGLRIRRHRCGKYQRFPQQITHRVDRCK